MSQTDRDITDHEFEAYGDICGYSANNDGFICAAPREVHLKWSFWQLIKKFLRP
jgi:hypothetical protein